VQREARRKPRAPITRGGAYAAKQILDPKLAQENRARIIDAALPLFAQHGYHGTPVRAIANAVGLSVGSIFNYFPDKDSILEEILDGSQARLEQAVAEAQERLEAAPSGADPVELFLDVYRRLVDATEMVRRFTLLAYQETKALMPAKRTPLLDRDRRIRELLKRAARPAIAAGVFSSDCLDLKVNCLLLLAHAWAIRRWALTDYRSVEHYFEDLTTVAVGVMSAQRSKARPRAVSRRN